MKNFILSEKNIVMVGMPGSGKTTVGKHLADQLNWTFVDTDMRFETQWGMSIKQYFETYSEKNFRDIESKMLFQLITGTQTVISTGGGIVLAPRNRQVMKDGSVVVYLDCPLNLLIDRLKSDQTRPLLHAQNLGLQLTHLLRERQSLYESVADVHILVADSTCQQVVDRVLAELKRT